MAAAAMLTACDEDTASLGIVDNTDLIVSTDGTFDVRSQTVLLDSVVTNSTKCYLGQIYDEETKTSVKADFATQFHTLENYNLPAKELMVTNEQGEIEADSVDVRLYFSNYLGLSTNPMKVDVYELDSANVLEEGKKYYADIDLDSYLPENAKPLTSKVFTPSDYTLDEADRTSTSHDDNVFIRLPNAYGTRIIRMIYDHPEWFANSWQFIHHVCPGLYFKLHSGLGTILTLDVSTMNVHFRYRDAQKDTIYSAYSRFSATAEVIQCTRIQNSDLSSFVGDSKPYTYLKSPAALATELTLPVDEVFASHERDSISQARLVLTRLNNEVQSDNSLSIPQNILLVRKKELRKFFNSPKTPDSKTCYVASFDATYNTYTFNNLSRLLTLLYHEKANGMASENLTSEQWNLKYPNWNKVTLVPVEVNTNTTSAGTTSVTSVSHDFSFTSTRLVGGSEPLKMQVIYSSYQ